MACLRAGPDGTMPCGSGKDASCCASNQCCVTDDSSCRNKCPSAGGDDPEQKFLVLLDLLFNKGKSMDGTCQCEPRPWPRRPTATQTPTCPCLQRSVWFA